jgi:hypothetical protein
MPHLTSIRQSIVSYLKLMRLSFNSNWSGRRKITTAVACLLVILLTSIVVLIKILSSPAVGTITPPSGKKIAVPTNSSAPGSYSGKYISFTYPSNFDISPLQKSGNFLEVVGLYSNDHLGRQVSIGVVPETLSNDSGVSYRRAHPEIYKELPSAPGSLIFTKDKAGSEYTGFLTHAGLVASVSLSSNYTKDLSADYKAIVKNWQWK